MENAKRNYVIPDHIKGMLTLVMAIVTAVLYAIILGGAAIRTLLEADPVFSDNAVRAASLLSGLVGSIVTAGFASSRPAEPEDPDDDMPIVENPAVMVSRQNPGRLRRNLAGLARVIGLPSPWGVQARAAAADGGPITVGGLTGTVWVALLYFAVYSVVGLASLLLSAFLPAVPDLVSSSAWVWLGTIVTSSYSFFGLD